MIEFDISNQSILEGQINNLYFEKVLVVDVVRHTVMVFTPRVLDGVCHCCVHHFVLLCISIVEDLCELRFEFRGHGMVLPDSLFNAFHHLVLLSDVGVLLFLERAVGLLKYVISMLQGHPFEPRHEFIYHF